MAEFQDSLYKNSVYWKIIDQSIDDLVRNQDIEEQTPRHYIVGYIVKKLEENITKSGEN